MRPNYVQHKAMTTALYLHRFAGIYITLFPSHGKLPREGLHNTRIPTDIINQSDSPFEPMPRVDLVNDAFSRVYVVLPREGYTVGEQGGSEP